MKKLLLLIMLCGGAVGAGRSNWVERYTTLLNDTVVSNFDGGANVEWTRYQGDSLVNDNVNTMHGSRSVRIYTTTNNGSARKAGNFNFSNRDVFTLSFYMPDSMKSKIDTAGEDLTITLVSGTGNALMNFDLRLYNTYGSGWYKFQIKKGQFSTTGPVAWDNITLISIALRFVAGQNRWITLDQFTAGNTPITNGGVVIWFDDFGSNLYTYGKQIFDRYGFKFTQTAKPISLGNANTQTIQDAQYLQANGFDVVGYPWDNTSLAVKTPNGIDTSISKVIDWMKANNFRGHRLFTWSQGAHNRYIDSVGISKGIQFSRGTGTPFTIYNKPFATILPLPMYDAKFSFGTYTFYNNPLDSLKMAVDTAMRYNYVTTLLFHGIATTTGVSTQIDTGRLDSLLKYCYDRVQASQLGYVGKFTNYLTYAPDSCISSKSRSGNIFIDSVSSWADSMRVVLYDSTVTGWDSIAGSIMKRGGSLCTLSVSNRTGAHRLRAWGKTNGGTTDSMLPAFNYTFANANPFRIDSVGIFNGLYFKGRF